MAAKGQKWRRASNGLVITPLVVLSLVTLATTGAVLASDRLTFVSPASLLISAALLYAATLFFLSRSGFASVRELQDMAARDALCDLPNRRALHADIQELSEGGSEIAIAIIDLDGFKQVNDHYGHVLGDELIKQCAQVLRQICGKEARCYRLGGDEFAALMSGEVAGTLLEGLCRSLLARLTSPLEVSDRSIVVGASIGLARSTPEARLSSSELMRRSDVAMYMSKRGGKMRCTWFSETFDQRREAVREIEDDLRNGLAASEFALFYQPLVNADSSKIEAVEALLRWNRKDGRSIGPNVFIPVAEESGLINPIGLWVLRQAVCDAKRWGSITLSVNISAAQLRNPEFPIKLGEILEETGFPPDQLELEVTETCLVLDPVVAERSLEVIRGFGVRISLDDFGTGYASIGFLRQFRFEKLKLDRSLVVQAGEDEGSRAMMLSSITLARALKMGVTAEGVETEEQAHLVRTAGCDQIQGWLYYKAMPAPEIDLLLGSQGAVVSALPRKIAIPSSKNEQAA